MIINGITQHPDVIFTGTGGDDAAALQVAHNNLLAARGGGLIGFKGLLNFASQLIINPNIGLVGQGPTGYLATGGAQEGSIIETTFNGSAIVVTGDARASTFPYLANFTMRGNLGGSQNGIEWNTSGGAVADTFVENVLLFNMGQHGYLIGGATTKILMSNCYAEFMGGAGIKQNAGFLIAENIYMVSNTNGYDGSGGSGGGIAQISNLYLNTHSGVGIQPLASGTTQLTGSRVDSCAGGAITNAASLVAMQITGNVFSGNGGTVTPSIALITPGTSQTCSIVGNKFYDTRGASAANNHIVLAGTNSFNGTIEGNAFFGNQNAAVAATARAASTGYVINNKGFNDTLGKLATPFAAVGKAGIEGTAAAPTASTAYVAGYTPLYIVSTGGTGVSITITDPGANAIQSGLASFTGILPVGWSINFGAFSVAPTVTVNVT